ncbi:hypothetical protein [Nannocystis punicea]|uniref:Ig-like domain-containing protein n=1 Tax=Nannocystis punicea TaxID=2995304 RepID=A0ABY7HBP9_9BACT|nr:hypothetical protein [Nannocystis poenicansa]WAS96682.1 hypothetical protein O0S08_11075 [Nannocystis poenicansa]
MLMKNRMAHVGIAVAVALASGALYAQTSSDMRGLAGEGVLAVHPVAATEAAPAAAAPPAAEPGDEQERRGFTVACDKPQDDGANFSWKEGEGSTTIYYHNHCPHPVKVTIHASDGVGVDYSECWKVKAGKKGKREIKTSPFGEFHRLTRGC